jgi:hypothetical protein
LENGCNAAFSKTSLAILLKAVVTNSGPVSATSVVVVRADNNILAHAMVTLGEASEES